MADTGMAEVLKTFAAKITTSKLTERRRILGDLATCVAKPEFPEPAIKGVLKHLLMTLGCYNDRKSRRAVNDVIEVLAIHQFDKFIKHFGTIVGKLGEQQKTAIPSAFNSGLALTVLDWTCLVMRHGYKSADNMQGDNFIKMVELQSYLLYGAVGAQKNNIRKNAMAKMKRVWSEVKGSVEKYCEGIGKIDQNIYIMCLPGFIVQYLRDAKCNEELKKRMPTFVELYVKLVIGSRTQPAVHLLGNLKLLLQPVTHEVFKDTILPAFDRAMLRNPEITLSALTYMLDGVSLDLSSYAEALGKHLATQLHSKEDSARDIAADGSLHLAKQCSDPTAVEKLVKLFFAVLNGSEGKMTVAVQRMGMLTGIGNLSHNTVSGANSTQNLSGTVAEYFLPFLQQEVHEGTLIHALSTFTLWCAKFATEVPSKVIQWFKAGFGQKTSTSLVRNAYIKCMNAAFHGDTLIQGLDVLPLLIQTVEKASNQANQVQLVTEAVSASCLLLKLSTCDIQAESKLGPFWSILLDKEKQLFTNDKFLFSASEDALYHLALVVEKLVMDHPQRLDGVVASNYYKAFVHSLTHGGYQHRKKVKYSAKKLLSALGGGKIAMQLLKKFHDLLDTQKLIDPENELQENGEVTTESSRMVAPHILTDSLMTLCHLPGAEAQEAEALIMETLFDAHHPCIMHCNNSAWTDIAAGLKVNAAKFIQSHTSDILSDIKNCQVITENMKNTVATLVRLDPDSMLPEIVNYSRLCADNPSLLTVTHMEYAIMNTPEGELWDKSVLEKGAKGDDKMTNVRRENKLYSYEDQLAEIELRKELEKKKKAKGMNQEPKLTKQQMEARQTQLEKESEIRQKTKEMDNQVKNACGLITSCVQGNPGALRFFIPMLIQTIIPLLSSPLAASRVSQLLVDLKDSAFYEVDRIHRFFSLMIVHVTLRLSKPQCGLNPGWSSEPVKTQVERAISQLFEATVTPKTSGQSSLPTPDDKAFPAPTFAYCFHLLKGVLKDGGVCVGREEKVLLQALEVISSHAKLRSEDGKEDKDVNSPQFLPRKEMFDLLVKVIGTNSGKVQQVSQDALLQLGMASSGMSGCAAAEQDEIDVLLQALRSPTPAVRESALQGLLAMVLVLPSLDADYENGMKLIQRTWVAKYDVEDVNKQLAERLWEEAGLELQADLCSGLVIDTTHNEEVIRQAAAIGLANALAENPDYVPAVLAQLMDVYEEKLYTPPPILDAFGRVISEAPPDEWPARSGLALAICKMSPYISEDEVETLFQFFVQKGLGDRSSEVRKHMLDAAVAVVNDHGKANVNTLLPVFEDFLVQAPDTASFDAVRQSVVILMGSLAKHLDKDDPKVKPIVAKLIETLSTPSQQVQEAVANCLPPLVPAIKADAPELVKKMLQLLLESANYGERKGASYGLAGLVKGLGILALKQLDIMTTLTDAIQNKKNPRYREGALFAFEMLCLMLGRLFEPYVVHVLPHLLLCFGDNNQFVRQAADDCAKAVMSKLSAHGVKLVLPSLLTAIEEDSWRTKTGSVELLGAMAFCAPKQLSACLPSIVPKLTEVLTDSHLKVQRAGEQALRQIGSVIKNPEIQAIVPTLLDALQDPTKKTTVCLQSLLETKFVHFIDAPSLALIMPVVQRAFQDRSTETRKMAAQIIGNMYSLTDQKDLSPYLPSVIPGLKASLLDPVPEVRSVSSRALGAIVKGMGESGCEDLLPWLMQTLTSENSSVDRSGAAQGLSEVVGGLGLDKLKELMPDIISTAERTNIHSHVRDGYIMMYIYLPSVFPEEFLQYVGPILPSVLKALADEAEFVRDTALKAGQRIINMYADTAVELLLPELEKGLFDDNWRIRYSSVQLLGDLLYNISGVSGKMTTESAGEDDNFGTETSQRAIMRCLGGERRNRVLAGLYMGRSDTALMVRQAALHVWKVIVTHTPKTLREILSTLFQLLLGCLASSSYDKRQVAARTLGDVVRKLGEKVLPEIIPILEKGLESDRSDQRQGVCIGLSEIMSSTSKDHVIVFADSLIPTVRKALCDPLPEVREAAAKTFDNLHSNIGTRALDDILPDMLKKLDNEELSEFALDGLKQVMAVKSRVVLPYLVPQLTTPPVNTRALSFLSSVAGEALTKHLNKILQALMSSLSEKQGTPDEEQELQYCQTVVLSVVDDLGVRVVMDELLGATSQTEGSMRWAAVIILHAYCQHTKADYSEYVPKLLTGVLCMFTDTNERVLLASWDCLNAITKKLDASDMLGHITNLRTSLRYAMSDFKGNELPGFCLPKKGITPILPIFREGILNGPPELKESAAKGLGDVIKKTSAEALKPSVVNITGPLIRILGDRFSFNVKVAVLETLGLLLGKCGAMLKPFLPQLQTTFVKALNDPNRSVRLKAASALGKLIVIHTRVDPLFTELHTGVKADNETAVRDTMLQALRNCIVGAGAKMSDAIRKQVTGTLEGLLSSTEDSTRTTAAACLGVLCSCLNNDELTAVLNTQLLETDASTDWVVRHGRAVALSIAVKQAVDKVLTEEYTSKVYQAALNNTTADRIPLSLAGIRVIGFVLRHQVTTEAALEMSLINALAKCMKHESNDIKSLTAQVISFVSKSVVTPLDVSVQRILVPMLVNGTKEKNTLVKTNSELALIALLRIRKGDQTLQNCLSALDSGMRESLNEVVTKVLRKVATQPDTGDDDIDDTVLV